MASYFLLISSLHKTTALPPSPYTFTDTNTQSHRYMPREEVKTAEQKSKFTFSLLAPTSYVIFLLTVLSYLNVSNLKQVIVIDLG